MSQNYSAAELHLYGLDLNCRRELAGMAALNDTEMALVLAAVQATRLPPKGADPTDRDSIYPVRINDRPPISYEHNGVRRTVPAPSFGRIGHFKYWPKSPQPFLLGNSLWPEGNLLGLLAAAGCHKSLFIMQLATCCIVGRPFLGIPTYAKGKNWFIWQREKNVDRMNHDLAQATQGFSPEELAAVNRHLYGLQQFQAIDKQMSLQDPDVRAVLEVMLQWGRIDILAVDGLTDITSGNLDSDVDMADAINTVTTLAQKYNVNTSILLTHHALPGAAGAAKAIGFESDNFGRNSKVLFNKARTVFNLQPLEDEDHLLLVNAKNSNGDTIAPFRVDYQKLTGVLVRHPSDDLTSAMKALAKRRRAKGGDKAAGNGHVDGADLKLEPTTAPTKWVPGMRLTLALAKELTTPAKSREEALALLLTVCSRTAAYRWLDRLEKAVKPGDKKVG